MARQSELGTPSGRAREPLAAMPPFTFCVVNLGCKVNRVEADGFERLLAERGGAPADEGDADLIVVNTCTVTGEAEKKTRKAVRHALGANAQAAVVVTGCATEIDRATYEAMDERVTVVPKAEAALYLAERFEAPERTPLPTALSASDALRREGALPLPPRPSGLTVLERKGQSPFPTDTCSDALCRAKAMPLPARLGGSTVLERKGHGPFPTDASPGFSQTDDSLDDPRTEGCEPPLLLDGRTRIGVKVQDGCDNACTYCIVHVARGRAVSRSADEVVAEAVALARAGVREIVLTGINLGSYDDDGCDLADLCRRMLDETADFHGPDEPPCRFRIGSVEPMDVSMEFVGLLAEAEGRLCRHLHLPLQSGSSKVLREMARPYDAQEFRQLVDYLRAMVPEMALTTDIIVGFPGETDEDFEDTCELARHCDFSKIHVFPYSRREGTPAAARADQVAPDVKAARAARLRALSDELAAADRVARAGATELALVETPERATTESYLEVAPPEGAAIGSLMPLVLPSA